MRLTAKFRRANADMTAVEDVGEAVYEHGRLRFHGSVVPYPGFQTVLDGPVRDENFELVDRTVDPETWIRSLPLNYCGSRFWIELKEE